MPPRVSKTPAIRVNPSRRGPSVGAPAIKLGAAAASPQQTAVTPALAERHDETLPVDAAGIPAAPGTPDADRSEAPDERSLHLRVRIARTSAGLSKSDLARRVGVCLSAVVQWELAKGTSPTVANLVRIARTTGVAFEWLATGRGSPVLPDELSEAEASSARIGFEKRLLKAALKVPAARRELVIEFALAIVKPT